MNPATLELLEQYLTPDERAQLNACLAQEIAPPLTTLTFREFVSRLHPRYEWYPHCEVLAATLQRVADDELFRVMVFMPPRHGKSELVSRHFPAYYLLRHPDRWAGLCSYEATLAQDFSRTARDAFQREGGQLRGDSSAVALWQTTLRGGMWAAGVGGPITGKGAHLGIIDDPVKNDEEAASETIRAKHKSWYDSTFYTRLEPRAAVVIVQTRWHEDDLSGYLLAQESADTAERWHILSFQAIKEAVAPKIPATCTLEADWREPDEALCPARYDVQALGRIRKRVGSYFWSALYQQSPTPGEGGAFKRSWWKYYAKESLPQSFDFLALSWDCAFKDTTGSDFVVGQAWAVKRPNAYLLDCIRDRMDFPTTCAAVKALRAKWPTSRIIWIEDKANGPAVVSQLRITIPGVVPVNPEGGKESRAAAVSPLVEAGNVYLPSDAHWVSDFVNECAAFPNAAHDDQVDAMTQALIKLAPMMLPIDQPPRPKGRSDPMDDDVTWKRLAERHGKYTGPQKRGVRVPRVADYVELD